MVVAACGTMWSSACGTTTTRRPVLQPPPDAAVEDAQSDSNAAPKQDATDIVIPLAKDAGAARDASAGEANAPVDADKTDLWNTICE
jgi:hypothetical protein